MLQLLAGCSRSLSQQPWKHSYRRYILAWLIDLLWFYCLIQLKIDWVSDLRSVGCRWWNSLTGLLIWRWVCTGWWPRAVSRRTSLSEPRRRWYWTTLWFRGWTRRDVRCWITVTVSALAGLSHYITSSLSTYKLIIDSLWYGGWTRRDVRCWITATVSALAGWNKIILSTEDITMSCNVSACVNCVEDRLKKNEFLRADRRMIQCWCTSATVYCSVIWVEFM